MISRTRRSMHARTPTLPLISLCGALLRSPILPLRHYPPRRCALWPSTFSPTFQYAPLCSGVKTASLLYEDHGNLFFTGVGVGAEKLLNEAGFTVHTTHKQSPLLLPALGTPAPPARLRALKAYLPSMTPPSLDRDGYEIPP